MAGYFALAALAAAGTYMHADAYRRRSITTLGVANFLNPPSPWVSGLHSRRRPLEHTMTTSVEELVVQASQLSVEDRTHLADLLLASVPEDESADIDAGWEQEIQRRVDAVRAGTAKTVSAEDVHAQARRLYQR